jgi:hypothetical protein
MDTLPFVELNLADKSSKPTFEQSSWLRMVWRARTPGSCIPAAGSQAAADASPVRA